MSPASLPAGTEHRRHRLDELVVIVGDDERNTGKSARLQRPQEGDPAGAVFRRDDIYAQVLSVPVTVDRDRLDHRDGADAPAFSHLLDMGVEPHVGVGSSVEGTVSKRLHDRVELPGELGDLRLAHPLDPELAHKLVHSPGRDSREVAVGHDLNESLLRPPAWLQQPLREVAASPQLGDLEIDRSDPSVPAAAAVTVAAVRALLAALAVGGVAGCIGICSHEHLGDHLDDVAQQVGVGLLQLLAHEVLEVHCGADHRSPPRYVLPDVLRMKRWSLFLGDFSPFVHHLCGH
jgi:hypothetical protein